MFLAGCSIHHPRMRVLSFSVGLVVLALLLASSYWLVRKPRRVRLKPPKESARSVLSRKHELAKTLSTVRLDKSTLGMLLADQLGTMQANMALPHALKGTDVVANNVTTATIPGMLMQQPGQDSEGLEEDAEAAQAVVKRMACPPTCENHGNCNELTGECNCPLTHRGAACDKPTMPACEIDSSGRVINLCAAPILTTQP